MREIVAHHILEQSFILSSGTRMQTACICRSHFTLLETRFPNPGSRFLVVPSPGLGKRRAGGPDTGRRLLCTRFL